MQTLCFHIAEILIFDSGLYFESLMVLSCFSFTYSLDSLSHDSYVGGSRGLWYLSLDLWRPVNGIICKA